jgi:hypothetical protein
MNAVSDSAPDHWLVLSPDVYRSLSNVWRAEAGPGSLLDLRLARGLIEQVAPAKLEERIGALADEAAGAIVIVVDEADPALVSVLDTLPHGGALHLVEWWASPLDAVLSMNAPDGALLAYLRYPAARPGAAPPPLIHVPDPEGYVASLARWEDHCRKNDADAFAGAYPAMAGTAIPWARLIGGGAAAPAAANDNWIALDMLAAATPEETGRAVTVDDPRNTPAQWKLTVSPVDGGPETLVVFRANPAAASSFIGCRVRLRMADEIVELGEVDEEGRAEVLLPAPVDMKGLSISWTEGE